MTNTTFDLTANEMTAALILVRSCLKGMGGKRPGDLADDPFTWVAADDLVAAGFSRFEAAGTFSALAAKDVISEYDRNEWVLNDAAWLWLDTVWDAHQA
jgi:hypothetical protein